MFSGPVDATEKYFTTFIASSLSFSLSLSLSLSTMPQSDVLILLSFHCSDMPGDNSQ